MSEVGSHDIQKSSDDYFQKKVSVDKGYMIKLKCIT
jgi:hypothetical protein